MGDSMSEDRPAGTPMSDEELQDLVASTDTGARNPVGPAGKIILGAALLWSLFQLWIASPIPFVVGFGVFNNIDSLSIHLSFAIFLTFSPIPH